MSMEDLPRKLYVELTTRCNLQCRMCVKHAPGSCIPEMDMDIGVFNRLLPALGAIDSLVLNGIGESLLHSRLPDIVERSRNHMKDSAYIGLQSNGLLLTEAMVADLIDRGLSTLCLSVDSSSEGSVRQTTCEHSFPAVTRAAGWIAESRKSAGLPFSLGLEIVLSSSTVGELVPLLRWAAVNGIDYILVSHLMAFDREAEEASLFNQQPSATVELYRRYQDLAESMGISFSDAFFHHRKTAGTVSDPRFSSLLGRLLEEVRDRDLRINFDYIEPIGEDMLETMNTVYREAEAIAADAGIDLHLPPLHALHPRQCRFIDERATFISVSGDVMPCHFLWHSYACRMHHEDIQVRKRVFGNVVDQGLHEIWNSRRYTAFRAEVDSGDYSPCWSCPQGPCSSLVSDDTGYGNDCFGSSVPCGHCQWNLGGIRCL